MHLRQRNTNLLWSLSDFEAIYIALNGSKEDEEEEKQEK